jgi:N-acetylglucosaminyl-diphospho-decaprenol L-rhamnosyltransferase
MADAGMASPPEDSLPARLTLAVVTLNAAQQLPGLIASLPDALAGVPSWELVIADNNSSDGTPQVVSELAPAARVVQLGRNAGYAAGINAAILAASPSSEAVLILNPDVRLMEGSVGRLMDALRLPNTGITVPRILDPQGRLQLSLRRDPTVLRALGEAVLGGQRAGRLSPLGEVVVDPRKYERPCIADWASGAVMMLSRQCLHAVGPWDESYFLYSEETDYAWRARQRCFNLRYVPQAIAVHLEGLNDQRWPTLTVNRVRLFTQRHGRLRGAAFRLAVILNEGLRALLGRAKHRSALRALLVLSLRQKRAAG